MPTSPHVLARLARLATSLLAVTACGTPAAQAGGLVSVSEPLAIPANAPARAPDVIFVPTPQAAVEAMLKVAAVGPQDVLYDLGSGDGRIPITAVKQHRVRKAVGIDIDPERIAEAEANRKKAGVGDRVTFINADLFETPIGEASVVTLYLLPSLNLRLLPKLLRELKPGTRIVSHEFDMGRWKPEQTLRVAGRTVHFWRIPAPGTPQHAAAMEAAR